MTNLPVAIVSALLLHAPAAGAFVLHCQHPAVLISFSGPTDGKSTLSVKEDVTDAADAVTIEIIESDLDASTFLAEMEEEIEGVAALKEAAGIETLIPSEAKVGDMYTRAIAKMEAMYCRAVKNKICTSAHLHANLFHIRSIVINIGLFNEWGSSRSSSGGSFSLAIMLAGKISSRSL